MSSYMSQGTKAVIKPPILTIVGFTGSGKSSLAGLFPKPAFIQAEDSQTVFQRVPVELQPHFNPVLPKPHKDKKGNAAKDISTRQVLIEQLMEFYTDDHPYETLVIDTATVTNDLFEEEMVEFYPGVTSSVQDAAGGFQKAFDTIAKWHDDIISKCKKIRDKRNMAIVFLAHSSERKKKNSPDVSGEYTVYSMRMHKKSEDVYISHSDAILYLKQTETMTGHVTDNKGNTTKRGRVRISDERVLITSSDGTVGYVSAKNRYGMPQEISVPEGTNPILQYIPFYKDYVEKNGLYVSQDNEQQEEE